MKKARNPERETGRIEQRVKVLLALAAQEPFTTGNCPGDEQLAAFIDNRLGPEEREAMLHHLDACSQCYRIWLELRSETTTVAQETGRGKVVPLQPAAEQRKAPAARKQYLAAGMITALAACLLLFLWGPPLRSPGLAELVDKSYRYSLDGGFFKTNAKGLRDLSLPWEKPSVRYGFGGAAPVSEASRAFGAGLWDGKEILARGEPSKPLPSFLSPSPPLEGKPEKGSWMNGPQAPYYLLGRWCILLQAICRSESTVSPAFCSWQHDTLDALSKAFSTTPTAEEGESGRIVQMIERVRFTLGKDCQGGDWTLTCQRIRPELDSLVERLAPARE
jgi:hypothetical protein